MQLAIPWRVRRILPHLLPMVAIVLARLFTFTSWADTNAGWAAAIFAWIVIDALMLGLLAKAPDHKPTRYQTLGVLAISSVVILAGAAAPVREVYLGFPQILLALGLMVAFYLVWSGVRVAHAWRESGSVTTAAERVLPPQLVRFVIMECRTLVLALFKWGIPADVPQGMRAFAYHTYLTPMIAAFLVLQIIELSVVHFLLMLWNPTVAWLLLALSIWGVIWTIALLKSFRINPVLLADRSVRVRSGMIYDFEVPIAQILDWNLLLSAEELAQKHTLNLAILSSPNISLRLAEPLAIPTFFGGKRMIANVALRLDDSAEFLAQLGQLKKSLA